MGLYTLQMMYDKARAYMTDQFTEPAYERNACRYRTEDNRSCLIGIFIPEALYDPGMEDNSVDAMCRAFPTVAEMLFGGLDMEALESFQAIHDSIWRRDGKGRAVEQLDKWAHTHDLELHPDADWPGKKEHDALMALPEHTTITGAFGEPGNA